MSYTKAGKVFMVFIFQPKKPDESIASAHNLEERVTTEIYETLLKYSNLQRKILT